METVIIILLAVVAIGLAVLLLVKQKKTNDRLTVMENRLEEHSRILRNSKP